MKTLVLIGSSLLLPLYGAPAAAQDLTGQSAMTHQSPAVLVAQAGATTPAKKKTGAVKPPEKSTQVIAIGTQLGHVIGEKEKEITKLAGEQAAAEADFSNWYNAWIADQNGEPQRHLRAGEELRGRCPPGTSMPIDQANACNAEIDAYNRRDQQLVDFATSKKAAKDQVVAEKQERINRLKAEQAKIAALQDSIVACVNDNVMRQKACLDQLFDNTSATASAYDLDATVVKPGPFGNKQITAEGQIQEYLQSGEKDAQIRKITGKKIVVPPPDTGQPKK